jgi:hypothetical protein
MSGSRELRARAPRRAWGGGRRRLAFPIVLLLFLALLLFLGSACGGGGDSPAAPRPEAASGADLSVTLEALRSIGYADWEEGADEALRGVTRRDDDRLQPGFHLYTNEIDEVRLVDMAGELRHRWRVEGRTHCCYAELLDEGRLLVVSADEGLTMLDWDSRVLWSIDMYAHHDLAPLADGSFLVLEWVENPDYRGRRVRFDRLLRVTRDGEQSLVWSAEERREELARFHPLPALDSEPPADPRDLETIYDYHHLNSVEELVANPRDSDPRFRAGNLLLCARNASLIFILDRDTLEVVWHWRPGTLDFPHMPTMTPEGNILLFDNGYHRGWSRVLELDPVTLEIVWSYAADPRQAFFTQERGSNQRFSNGNTLILESQRGRAFEVTRDGELVWEYWNPETREGKRRRIYRLLRIGPERLPASIGPVSR